MDTDYSGVPVAQLRAQIEKYLNGRSKRWLSEATDIDPRELDRIMEKAPDHAVIGLHKADKILLALGQNLTILDVEGEINVVPLGSNLHNAKLMAEDWFAMKGQEPQPIEVYALGRIWQHYKEMVLAGEVITR